MSTLFMTDAELFELTGYMKAAWLRGRFIFVEDFLSRLPRVLPRQTRTGSAHAIAEASADDRPSIQTAR